MNNKSLAIGIAHDGVTQDSSGKDRQAFENLIHTLLTYSTLPLTLCFFTEGVRWVTRESPFIQELREIGARGADILVCRAAMSESGLFDQLAIGKVAHPDMIDDVLLQAEHAMVL